MDHCHKTKKFRGWLCNQCNFSIGGLGDDVEGVIKALNYLCKCKGMSLHIVLILTLSLRLRKDGKTIFVTVT